MGGEREGGSGTLMRTEKKISTKGKHFLPLTHDLHLSRQRVFEGCEQNPPV